MSITGNVSGPRATTPAHPVNGAVATCAAAGLLVGGLATMVDRAPVAAIATGTTVALLLLTAAIAGRSELSTGGVVALSLTSAAVATAALAVGPGEVAAAPAATLTGWSAVALVLALHPGARRLTGVAIAAPTLAFGVAGLGAVAIWSSTAFQAVALLTIGAPLGLLLLVGAGARWLSAVGLGAAAGALAAITDLDSLTDGPGFVTLALAATGFLVMVAARQPDGVVDAELLSMATFIGILGAGLWCGPASVATAAVALVVVRRVPPNAPAVTEPTPRGRAQTFAPVVDEGEPWW